MALNVDEIVLRIRTEMRAVDSVDAALLAAVRTTCLCWPVPYGEVWTSYTARPVLYLKASWSMPDLDLADFVTASRKYALAPGVGLAGRIWQSRQLEIIEDIRVSPDFARQSIMLAAGFKAAVGSPVFLGNDLIAVLVFLMFERKRQLFQPIERIGDAVSSEASERWRAADT